jgi:ADP-ribose pyrophosphatase
MSDPKTLSSEIVFDGKHIKVRVDQVAGADGKVWAKEIVVHPGAVCVVALLGDAQSPGVLLVRQYRHAAGRDLLEICAGGLNPGEDPLKAAVRELEEETGYRAGKIVERGRFWTTPGFTTEFMVLYEATDLVKTAINLDEDESIEVEIVSREEALRMIDDGRIQDAKSILGLLRVFSHP